MTHRQLRSLLARLRDPRLAGPAIVIIGATTITALGFADVGIGWILAGTATLTFAALEIGKAVDRGTDPERQVRSLSWALASVILVLAGSWLYPMVRGEDPQPRYYVLAGASEVECVTVEAQPGGKPLELAPKLCGGTPYPFECSEDVDGSPWLRLMYEPPYWVPADALDPVSTSDRSLAECS